MFKECSLSKAVNNAPLPISFKLSTYNTSPFINYCIHLQSVAILEILETNGQRMRMTAAGRLSLRSQTASELDALTKLARLTSYKGNTVHRSYSYLIVISQLFKVWEQRRLLGIEIYSN